MWASCVGGAEPKDTYLERIKGAGFSQVEVVGEAAYRRSVGEREEWKRNLLSISIRGTKPAV